MKTTASRLLGTFERAQALTGERFAFNLVVAMGLSSRVEAGALREALDSLQGRHPLLRSRIVGEGRTSRFELGDTPPIPLECLERTDDRAWRQLVELELRYRFDTALGPMVRCGLLSSSGQPEVDLVWTFHHAIVDGPSILRLLDELCTHLFGESRSEPSGSKPDLPPSADQRFPAPFRAPRCWPASARFVSRQLLDEVAFRWRHRGRQSRPPDGPFGFQILPLAFSESETHELVRATRRRRVGLTSALNAAMLLAVVRQRHQGRANVYRCFAMPDLRSYLDPPVPGDVVGSFLTMMRLSVEVAGDTDLWTLAEHIHRLIESETRGGAKFLSARWSTFSMRALLGQRSQRMSTIALSYSGGLPASVPARDPIVRLHAFVSNFPRGPEYTAQTRIFRRRLWLDIVTLDVDMDRSETQEIADEMRALLQSATRRTGQAST